MGHKEPAEISNQSFAHRCYFNIQARGFIPKSCHSYITVSQNSVPEEMTFNSFLGDQPPVADNRHIPLIQIPLSQAYNANPATGGRKTKQRWAWFSAARRRDDELGTRLGTLNYLPLEIRRVVYDYVVQYYHIRHHVEMDISTWQYVGRHEWVEDGWYWDLGYTERL